jgi:membrane-associated phospholipid phosphatase
VSFAAVLGRSPLAFGGSTEALGKRLRRLPARLVFLLVGSVGAFLLAGLMISLGLFVSQALLSVPEIRQVDANVPRWIAGNEMPSWATASSVAYRLADVWVLAPLVGVSTVALALAQRTRSAMFLLLAALVELWGHALTSAFLRWQDANSLGRDGFPLLSFPAGRVAAAIAVYGGVAFVLSAEVRNWRARFMTWVLALAISIAVAASLMYRGDHHLVDLVGGVTMGAGALFIALLAEQVAGVVAELRRKKHREAVTA